MACAVRQVDGDQTRKQPYSPAFLLPRGAGLAPSLVLPSGWYQRDALREIKHDEGTMEIRLTHLLGRGFDYDRANFNAAA